MKISKAKQSLYRAIQAQDENEHETRTPPVENESCETAMDVGALVNGVRTCIPLLVASLDSDKDDVFQSLNTLIFQLKSLSSSLIPEVIDPNEEITQQVYALRALLIQTISNAVRYGREDMLEPAKIRELLSGMTRDEQLYAETGLSSKHYRSYMAIRLSAHVQYHIRLREITQDNVIIKQTSERLWRVIQEKVASEYGKNIDDDELVGVLSETYLPLCDLFGSVIERTKREQDTFKHTCDNEESIPDPVQRAINMYQEYVAEVVDISIKKQEVA